MLYLCVSRCARARTHREGQFKGKTCEMSSYTDFFSYTAMINLDPTTWRTRPSDRPPFACGLLQGDLPHDDADDEEQDHQGEKPGAGAVLLAGQGHCGAGAAALRRPPPPKPSVLLREQVHKSKAAQRPSRGSAAGLSHPGPGLRYSPTSSSGSL